MWEIELPTLDICRVTASRGLVFPSVPVCDANCMNNFSSKQCVGIHTAVRAIGASIKDGYVTEMSKVSEPAITKMHETEID